MKATLIITTETNQADDLKLALDVVLAGVRACQELMEPDTVMVRVLPEDGGLEFKFTTRTAFDAEHQA